MDMKSSQEYLMIERKIEAGQQYEVETIHNIQLYENKIITSSNTFLLTHVHDVSYKALSNGRGFLYLHTNQGVFPYFIESSPWSFIQTYKKISQ